MAVAETQERATKPAKGDLLARVAPSAAPLIITVFGDSIAPRGGGIWLTDLITLMGAFDVSERLVRTGVFRLSKEGWLTSTSEGRRSYYKLTGHGVNVFAEADKRIYASHAPSWNGKWQVVQMLPQLSASDRKKLREDLLWHGFGQLSPTALLKPEPASGAVAEIVNSTSGNACLMTANLDAGDPVEIARAAWPLSQLNDAYQAFCKMFSNFTVAAGPTRAFQLRTLLVHEYRRILLKDPQLPAELLPDNWSGHEARRCAASIYRQVTPAAETCLDDVLGRSAQAKRTINARFME